MDIMQLLQGQMTDDVINQLSQETGASPEQAQTAASGIFSTLLGGLAKNAQTPQGASGILSALDRDHDGSVLNDVMGLLSGSAQANPSALNGAGILQHVLGGQQQGAAQMISQASGMDKGGVMNMMMKLAPIVMGTLGQARQQQGFDASGLAGLLGGAVKQQQSSNPLMQMATRFLDKDGDGSVMDDLAGMVGSKLLGGFFKK
jgi:hypothetical protein